MYSVTSSWLTSAHVWEAGEEESEEEVEDDQVAHQNRRHEVGDAGAARHEDAVPHGFYPLPAQHSEHDHEAKQEEHDHEAEQGNEDHWGWTDGRWS